MGNKRPQLFPCLRFQFPPFLAFEARVFPVCARLLVRIRKVPDFSLAAV